MEAPATVAILSAIALKICLMRGEGALRKHYDSPGLLTPGGCAAPPTYRLYQKHSMFCGAGEQAQAACNQAAQRHADHAARALALSEGTGGPAGAADA